MSLESTDATCEVIAAMRALRVVGRVRQGSSAPPPPCPSAARPRRGRGRGRRPRKESSPRSVRSGPGTVTSTATSIPCAASQQVRRRYYCYIGRCLPLLLLLPLRLRRGDILIPLLLLLPLRPRRGDILIPLLLLLPLRPRRGDILIPLLLLLPLRQASPLRRSSSSLLLSSCHLRCSAPPVSCRSTSTGLAPRAVTTLQPTHRTAKTAPSARWRKIGRAHV